MCPLRFILVFFSAVLAGYFAWRTVLSSPEADDMVSDDSTADQKTSLKDQQEFNLKRMIQNGIWVFVDMASGRYLWRNLKEMKKDATLKSSFILVFFSAVLAGYFAWRTVLSSPEADDMVSDDSTAEKTSLKDQQEFNLKRMIQNGIWIFVDMASGRYLWRNLKEMKKDATLKSS
uniref:Bulb-type lectin domain-containing protein n=2 Tax=Salix viminalis TaxID=40686 RepID=A0A6N2KGN1_SALVM